MQGVFDGPVAARIGQEACGVGGIVGDIEACFRAGFVADEACDSDAGDALEVRPVVPLLKSAAILGDLAAADFEAAMALIGVFVRGEVCLFWRSLEEEAHVVMQQALIALEAQQVMPAAFDNLSGDLALAAHGIDRHRRAAQVEQVQQFWDGGDFINLLGSRDLSQHQPRFGGKGAHQM